MATITYNSNTTVTGTNNADLLLGTDTAGNNNDIVYGLQGDDTITSRHVAPFALNNSTLYGGQVPRASISPLFSDPCRAPRRAVRPA